MDTLHTAESPERLHASLKEIRLSIIGDEEEKQALLQSASLDTIFLLMEQLSTGQRKDDTALGHLLVILYSISLLPNSLPTLVSKYNFFAVLVRVANKYRDTDDILINVLNILSNVLSSRKDFNLDLASADGLIFHNILFHRLDTSPALQSMVSIAKRNRILMSIFSLIPHLNPTELKTLLPPSLRILEAVVEKPLESLLEVYGKRKIYTECYDQVFIPLPPKMMLFASYTAPMLFSLSHMLYQEVDPLLKPGISRDTNVQIDLVLGPRDYFVISSLLKAQDPDLKLAAITVLYTYSVNSDLSDAQKSINVQKMLPYLIQLINLEDSNDLAVYKSDLNLSRKFNPFYILSKLSLNFDFVNDFLLSCNIIVKFCDVVSKFGKVPMSSLSVAKLDNLCFVFLILSSLTATKESNRMFILSTDLTQTVEMALEFHNERLLNFMASPEATNEENLLTINELAVSVGYLLRSFSRSISTLRTYLNETKIVEHLLAIIKIPEHELTAACQSNSVLLNGELLLKTVTLAIISNVVLDFSPLRKELLSGGLINIIAQLMNETENQSILLNSLWAFRHIIYNEKVDMREKYLGVIGLNKIVEFCNHEDHQIQEMAFNVLRNLTTDSKTHVTQILNFFNEENEDSEEKKQSWLNFLLMKMESFSMHEKQNEQILEAMVYVVVHIATTDESCRDLVVRNQALMIYIRELMTHCTSQSVKMACVWVLINLTWVENIQQRSGERASVIGFNDSRDVMEAEDTSDVRDFDVDAISEHHGGSLRDLRALRRGVQQVQRPRSNLHERVARLGELGFPQVLRDMSNNGENLDFKERVKVALANFDTLTRNAGGR